MALSTAFASAVAFAPALVISSPAQAAIPGIVVDPPSQIVAEGEDAEFTLTNSTNNPINVTPTVTAGVSASDYDGAAGTFALVAVPANGNATVILPIKADDVVDDNETATITFTAGADTATSAVTIRDVGFTLTGATVSEAATTPAVGNNPAVQRTTRITATLAAAAPTAVEIPLDLEDGNDTATSSAEAGNNQDRRDYSYGNNTVITIAQGNTSGYLDVTLFDDSYDEDDTEYIEVVAPLAGRIGASRLNSTADATRVNITDNDATPTVSIGGAGSVQEGDTLPFPLTLSGASERAVSVTVNTTNGVSTTDTNGAASPGDYDARVNETVVVPPYNTAALVLVDTNPDNLVEGTEKLSATISNPMYATLGTPTTAEASIADAQAAPTVAVTGTSGSNIGPEGAAGETVRELTFTLNGPSTIPVRIAYAFTGGTATKGVDYKATDGIAVIPAGSLTATVPVTIVGDTVHEPGGETFNLVLSTPNSSVDFGGQTSRTLTILDDDAAPTYATTAAVAVTEGGVGTTSTATIPVTLSGATNQAVLFNLQITPGSGATGAVETGNLAGDDDYDDPTMMQVTIPAGSTTTNVTVPIKGDAVYEKDQTFTVAATPAANQQVVGNSAVTSTVTITNDDAAPKATFNETSGTEGTTIRALGTIVGQSEYPYTLRATWTGSGTAPNAASANDSSATNTTGVGVDISVPRGYTGALTALPSNAQGVPLADLFINQDTLDEPTEGWAVTLTENTSPLTGFATSTGVYKFNDDPGDLPRSAAITDETIGEDEQSVDVYVNLALQGDTTYSTQPTTVAWSTEDGTAKQGQDYTKRTGVLTIAPDDSQGKINIPILDDDAYEEDETFTVKLGVITPNGAIVTRSSGTVTIESEDDPSTPTTEITLAGPASRVGPGTVTLSGKTDAGASVKLWSAPFNGDDNDWTQVGSPVTASSSGAFTFKPSLTKTGLKFKVQTGDAMSDEVKVKLDQVPELALSSSARGTVYAKVTSGVAGSKFLIQRQNANGTWTTAFDGNLLSNGAYNKSLTGQPAGRTVAYRVYAYGNSSTGVDSGTSVVRRVAVR